MTGIGAVLVSIGAFHALIVAASHKEHTAGMHLLVWGAALVIAGRVT